MCLPLLQVTFHGGNSLPVLEAMVAQLLDHIRKGQGAALYQALLSLAEKQVSSLEAGRGPIPFCGTQGIADAENLYLSQFLGCFASAMLLLQAVIATLTRLVRTCCD